MEVQAIVEARLGEVDEVGGGDRHLVEEDLTFDVAHGRGKRCNRVGHGCLVGRGVAQPARAMTKGQEEADDEAVGADEGSAAAAHLHAPSAGQSTVQSRFTSEWQSVTCSQKRRGPPALALTTPNFRTRTFHMHESLSLIRDVDNCSQLSTRSDSIPSIVPRLPRHHDAVGPMVGPSTSISHARPALSTRSTRAG